MWRIYMHEHSDDFTINFERELNEKLNALEKENSKTVQATDAQEICNDSPARDVVPADFSMWRRSSTGASLQQHELTYGTQKEDSNDSKEKNIPASAISNNSDNSPSFKNKIMLILGLLVVIVILSQIDLKTKQQDHVEVQASVSNAQSTSSVKQDSVTNEEKDHAAPGEASTPAVDTPGATAGRDPNRVYRAFLNKNSIPQAK